MAERKNLGWSSQLNQFGDPTGTDHFVVEYVDGTRKPLCGTKACLRAQWAKSSTQHRCIQCMKKMERTEELKKKLVSL